MRELPLPRVLKDVVQAMQASTPHLQAANSAQEKVIALLQVEHSGLSPDEEAARRREIDELWGQVRQEHQAAQTHMNDLKAHYPGWIS